MELSGKIALVTGGTDGIGREIAGQLRAKGATVIVSGRDLGRLAEARAEGFETIGADLSTPAGVDTLAAAMEDRPLDILVNNAGMGATYQVGDEIIVENVEQCLFLNLHAPIELVTRLLPALRARPEAMIVNVTSGLAIAPRASGPIYCATKAGLRSFTMALRAQLAKTRIHVLEVLPPVVETRMTAGNRHKKMPASECARQVIRAMEKDRDEANVGMTKVLRLVESVSPALARRVMLGF
jgi:uncharacterized oxidoreductase